MTTNQTRQPDGIPTGGQFATNPRSESALALTPSAVSPVGACPDCGASMPGRIGVASHEGREVDVHLPGSQCPSCPHTVAEMTFESDPDDEGYWYETSMGADGTLTCDGFDEHGDHTTRLWAYEPGHPNYDDEAKAFHTDSETVTAGLAARDGNEPSPAPFVLTTQDRVTVTVPSELSVGDTVLLDDSLGGWYPATITSLDNDHKSTSIEFDRDETTIASYVDAEPFIKVQRGSMTYVVQRDLDVNQAVADVVLRDALDKATEGDTLVDTDGDSFVLGSSTATRYYGNCSTCADAQAKNSSFFPSHKASSRCQSGGRNHCTCDTCF